VNVAVYPPGPEEAVVDGIELAGASVVEVAELVPESPAIADADVLIVGLHEHPMRRLRELSRITESVGLPVVVLLPPENLALVESAEGITDLMVGSVDPVELRVRLRRIVSGRETEAVLRFKDLEIDPPLYRASLAGEQMDLTFMEYELLRFLVENPVRVWSREQLLSKVWGYEYYGGARTVDVHIRRLRSKLGEERSSWITTVRSVGYRFG
jgi:DNA-binding response OmpR family regulator